MDAAHSRDILSSSMWSITIWGPTDLDLWEFDGWRQNESIFTMMSD